MRVGWYRVFLLLSLPGLLAACSRFIPVPSIPRNAVAVNAEAKEGRPAFVPLDEAMRLIEGLAKSGHRMEFTGDTVTYPVEYPQLVALGSKAVPTILNVAESPGDRWTLDLLIEILGRIGDERARPFLESLIEDPRPNTRSEAVGALGRLGNKASIPALKRALAGLVEKDRYSFGTLQVLDSLLRLEDESAVPEILEIGRNAKDLRFYASRILSRFSPLRKALGFKGEAKEGVIEGFDEDEFLEEADYWYHHEVLGDYREWREKR